jgi:hypothetical protein
MDSRQTQILCQDHTRNENPYRSMGWICGPNGGFMDVVIKKEFPPNIEDIRKAFPLTGTEIFAYDKVIYHPGAGQLTIPLIAHEKCHFEQQGNHVAWWWKEYIANPDFRFEQELFAHRVELSAFCAMTGNRNYRYKYLDILATRLLSPMYGENNKRYNKWALMNKINDGRFR